MNSRTLSAPPRYRGRFAPSPTGPLHFGSLVAALASYCDARVAGGEWLLRIEDVDAPRARTEAEAAILGTLELYGFRWDETPIRQSARGHVYDRALARLAERGAVYACACTRRELGAAPLSPAGEHVYPGACRDGVPADRADRPQRAWRVKVGDARIGFRDRLQARQTQDLSRDVGDFVVKRADGLYAYQLAVVVDDHEQAITHVVRGADLLASTARQIFLQRLLGYAEPSYLHVPVAINAAGEKLSKQTHAAALPREPLSALVAAWHFLQQPWPERAAPATVAEFWEWSVGNWNPARLPPTTMLAAPRRFEASVRGKV